mgnify:FL=1
MGSTASIYIPCSSASDMNESGVLIQDAKGVTDKGWKEGYRQLEVVYGTYRFVVD